MECGAAERDRPEAGGESLLGDGCRDPRLGGAQGVGDPADTGVQGVVVNIRAHRAVCLCEGGQGPVGCPGRAQDEESAERAESGETGVETRVEVHEVQ
ncbi:hypothetical protein SGRIM128S_00991 [Streptomyces griseomycini]